MITRNQGRKKPEFSHIFPLFDKQSPLILIGVQIIFSFSLSQNFRLLFLGKIVLRGHVYKGLFLEECFKT